MTQAKKPKIALLKKRRRRSYVAKKPAAENGGIWLGSAVDSISLTAKGAVRASRLPQKPGVLWRVAKLIKTASLAFLSAVLIAGQVIAASGFEAHVINVTARICQQQGETRTIGYWKNHPEVYLPLLPQFLGATPADEIIDTQAEVNGIFNAANSVMRNKLKKQLLAMKFNIANFGIGEFLVESESKTLDEIVADADNLLRADPAPPNSVLEGMKDLLDYLNNLHQIDFCRITPPPTPTPSPSPSPPPPGKHKVVGWGVIGPRVKPDIVAEIFAYTGFLPEGKVQVQDKKAGIVIENTQLDSVFTNTGTRSAGEPLIGEITGKATLNGAGPYNFTVQVMDDGNPPEDGEDTFEITIPAISYSSGGKLSSGNLKVIIFDDELNEAETPDSAAGFLEGPPAIQNPADGFGDNQAAAESGAVIPATDGENGGAPAAPGNSLNQPADNAGDSNPAAAPDSSPAPAPSADSSSASDSGVLPASAPGASITPDSALFPVPDSNPSPSPASEDPASMPAPSPAPNPSALPSPTPDPSPSPDAGAPPALTISPDPLSLPDPSASPAPAQSPDSNPFPAPAGDTPADNNIGTASIPAAEAPESSLPPA